MVINLIKKNQKADIQKVEKVVTKNLIKNHLYVKIHNFYQIIQIPQRIKKTSHSEDLGQLKTLKINLNLK